MTIRAMALALALVTSVLRAQAEAEEEKNQDDPAPITAGWDGSHPFIKSADGDFVMEFGGRLHLDYRAHSANFAPDPTFVMRRARLELEGIFYGFVEFKVQADFADDESTLLRDGFINIRPNDAFQVMAGQYKAPFSQEEYIQSSRHIEFVERSLLNNLAPGRSPGVMVHGSLGGGVFDYRLSVQNDRGELGINETTSPDVFANLRLTPFRDGAMKNFSIAGAVGRGKREGERFIRGRTPSRSVVFFERVPLNGMLLRYNLEGWWFHENVKLQAEYLFTRGERQLLPDVEAEGFYVQGTYVLTGESKGGSSAIVPKRSVHEGGLGAWEIGVRFAELDVIDAGRGNRGRDWTLGVNWWLNPFLRYQANFSFEEFLRPPDPSSSETTNFAFVSRIGIFF